jgi:formylglycine-generating enzyme required for sulfatase activity
MQLLDAVGLQEQLAQARARTDELFARVRPEALDDRPVPERHRLVFYLGHLEAFDWNLICKDTLGMKPFHSGFERLFAFGIDPPPGQLPSDKPEDWPAIPEILRYNCAVRGQVDEVLSGVPEQIVQAAIEHRWMHAETMAYLLHNLPVDRKIAPENRAEPECASIPGLRRAMVQIPAGDVTLGKSAQSGFGWDNEFPECTVAVPAFSIDKYKVTNLDYLEFVNAGAEPSFFWIRRHGEWWLRTMFSEIPLPLHWPVYVTQSQAREYARWRDKRVMSEAEYHRCAHGTGDGEERPYPWGEQQPGRRHGNFDFRGWDPVGVTTDSDGDSAFGVSQLVGNGWEWTLTVFAPFPGFEPQPFYPGYSANFFDGEHYVLKGGSPRTAATLLRRSFRNWFRPSYPYVYATFRCAED